MLKPSWIAIIVVAIVILGIFFAPMRSVTVTLTMQGDLVHGGLVTIDGKSVGTDANGQATISGLDYGTYTITVFAYERTKTEVITFDVLETDKDITITMYWSDI